MTEIKLNIQGRCVSNMPCIMQGAKGPDETCYFTGKCLAKAPCRLGNHPRAAICQQCQNKDNCVLDVTIRQSGNSVRKCLLPNDTRPEHTLRPFIYLLSTFRLYHT